MICRYCGKKIPDDAVYCSFCGKKTESHLRTEKTESHLRIEDRDEDQNKRTGKNRNKRDNKYKDEYEEPKGKRRTKALISIIAAIVFVAAAFIAIMVFAKPYLGEEPWPESDDSAAESDEMAGFPKNMYISAEDGLLLCKDPGTESTAIHLINYGREIEVEKIVDGWAYTTVDGLPGWCSAEYLTENKDEIKQSETKPESDADKGQLAEPARRIRNGYHGTVNSEDGLNLRCGPGQEYDILLVVPYKTEVIEEGWDSGWIFIDYKGQYGWVNADYITPTGEVEQNGGA